MSSSVLILPEFAPSPPKSTWTEYLISRVLALNGMHSARETVLSIDMVPTLSKETLQSLHCEWEHCNASLNCWQAYFEHSKRHCPSHTPYKCSWGKCAYKTTKKKEILKHIENQHATRIPLPCPVLGCNEFIRRHNYLQTHFQTFHQRMIGIPLRRKDLKPSSRMFAPSLPPTLPPLPQIPLPVYLHPPMPVRPSSRPRKSRRPRKPSEDRDPEELQFAPLQPIEYENGLFQDFIVRPRHTAPLLQLAFPQAMLAVLPREETPPPSMGYDVFALKTEDLTTNGVIDDSHPSNSQPPKR